MKSVFYSMGLTNGDITPKVKDIIKNKDIHKTKIHLFFQTLKEHYFPLI